MPRLLQLGLKLLLKGNSAGGSLEQSTSFRSNPQLLLHLKKTSEVTIVVTQVEGPQIWKIGAYIFRGDGTGLPLVAFPPDSLVARASHAAETVELKVKLEASPVPYVVIPCTLSAGQECKLGVQFSTPVENSDGEIMKVELMPKRWKKASVQGEWSDNTAGGPASSANFLNNPMFTIVGSQATSAHIILSQLGKPADLIGMYIIKESDLPNLATFIASGKQIGTTGFQSSEEAIISLNLKATDKAVIIPATSKVGSAGQFEITIFSEFETTILPIQRSGSKVGLDRPSAKRPAAKAAPKQGSPKVADVITRQASRTGVDEKAMRSEGIVTVKGEWVVGKNAGGCINHYTWRQNDQYLISMPEGGELTVRLQQAGTNSIGFYILRSEGPRRKLMLTADDLVGKGAFQRNSEVSTLVNLSSGTYVLIPCTFEPNIEGRYLLSVAGPEGLSVKLISEQWSCTTVEGEWRGPTAGGCRNHATWVNNLQYQLKVLQPCNIVVILAQGIDEEDPRSIGFYVTRSSLALERTSSTDNDEAKGLFTSADEVWTSFTVSQLSVFNIIPCTFEAGIQQTYRLIIFSSVPESYIKLTPIPANAKISGGSAPSSPAVAKAMAKASGGGSRTRGGSNTAASNARNAYVKTMKFKAEGAKTQAKEVGTVRKQAGSDWKMSTLRRNKQEAPTYSGTTVEYREFKLEGAWTNETSGGCLNYPTWKSNPHFLLTVSKPTKAIVMVAQDIEKESDSVSLNSIGFYITKCDPIGKRPLRITRKELVAASVFSESMDVSVEVDLNPSQGPLVVIPCTYFPGTISPFFVSVFVESSSKADISLTPIADDWSKSETKGQWKGESAGGAIDCETFKNNPKVLMAVNQKGVYNIILTQRGNEDLHAIGFYVMKGQTVVSQSDFGREEEVSLRLELPDGDYNLVPACLIPGKESAYTITVYGEFPLAALETPEARTKTLRRANLPAKKRTLTETLKRNGAKRDRVATEILQTEQTYCKGLDTLRTKYMEPIRAKITPKGELISEDQFRVMFSNVLLILGYNSQLLKDIETKLGEAEIEPKLGEVFLKHCEYLKIYAEYCNNYNKALEVLRVLTSNKKFLQLVDNCKENSASPLSLTDFLIMPIQRIPRYVMLLQELVKYTDEGHPDYVDINAALGKIKEIAAYLNEKKREAENREKIVEINEKISGLPAALPAPSRKFLREGALTSVLKGKKNKSMAFLFNDLLVIVDQKFKFQESIPLSDTSIYDDIIEDSDVSFSLQTKGAKPVKYGFVFAAPNERNTWLVDIKSIFRAGEKITAVRTA